MNRILLASLICVFTACVDTDADLTDAELDEIESDATVPTSVTEVTKDEYLTISGATGSSRYFKIVVPAGYDHVTASRQTYYHADVYIKREALPSTTSYDCRAPLGTSSCAIDYPAAGTYYVLVRGTGTSGYSNMSFHVDYRDTYSRVGNNASVSIYNQYGYDMFFKLDVPAGAASVSFRLTLDPSHYGSVDLGVARGHFVEQGYNCWRELGYYESVMTATCTFINPPAGTYYVALNGHASHYEGTFEAWSRWPLTPGTTSTATN